MPDRPPPPDGFDSWLDFAMEHADFGNADNQALFAEIASDVEELARAELAELKRDHEAMNRLRSHKVDAVGWNDVHTTRKGISGPSWAAWSYGLDWLNTQGVAADPAEAILAAKAGKDGNESTNP